MEHGGAGGSPDASPTDVDRYRQVFRDAPCGIAITDLGGRIEEPNGALCRMVGVPAEQLTGTTLPSVVDPADRPATEDAIGRVGSGASTSAELEVRCRDADGTVTWVRQHVGRLRSADRPGEHLMVLMADVTGHREVAESLRRSEEHFRSLFEHAGVGVAHVGLDGRFVRVNPAFEAITGRSSAELVGLTFDDITHPDDLQADLDQAERLLAGDISGYTIRKRYLRPDGCEVWVQLNGSLVRGPSGEPDHFVAVVEDVTDALVREERERRSRELTELTSDVVSRLEGAGTATGQAEALVDELVPRFADYATVEAPDEDRPVLAVAHRDPTRLRVLLELREQHRVDPDRLESVARAALGDRLLIATVTPELLDRFDVDDRGRELWHQLGPRSHLSVPVDLGGGRRGALMVGRTEERRPPFTPEDLEFLDGLARRAGVFLVGAHLRSEEHRISLRLQQALLPDRLGADEDVDVAARYQPAAELLEVGGDWFDSIELADGRLLLVAGDVVGHGLEAAAVMGRLRAGLGALATQVAQPGRLLAQLDEFARGPQGADFATVCCATLDPSTGELVHASAGHPPMLVVGPAGESRWLTDGASPPLCTFPLDERPQAATVLEPGSLVVMYSDGLFERRGEPITDGLDRLRAAAVAIRHLDPGAVCDGLIAELADDATAEDDVVVLVVRFRPGAARAFRRRFAARPRELGPARDDLAQWAERWAVPASLVADLQLAVGEASANAVEHAYAGGTPGTVEVLVEPDGDGLVVRVADDGRWRSAGHAADRGRGLPIMEALSPDLHRETGPAGTVVTMRLALPT